MSGMFWIALELSIPKIGLNIMLSLTVKKLDAFKFDGVTESDTTADNPIKNRLGPVRSSFLLKMHLVTCVQVSLYLCMSGK